MSDAPHQYKYDLFLLFCEPQPQLTCRDLTWCLLHKSSRIATFPHSTLHQPKPTAASQSEHIHTARTLLITCTLCIYTSGRTTYVIYVYALYVCIYAHDTQKHVESCCDDMMRHRADNAHKTSRSIYWADGFTLTILDHRIGGGADYR